MLLQNTSQSVADAKFYQGYSRYMPDAGRYETWTEAVTRVGEMHLFKYKDQIENHPQLKTLLAEALQSYDVSEVLGAQRALQFGGEQLLKHHARLYNCSSAVVNRIEFFQEAMYLLLCGCGVGFSVQNRHISQLPDVAPRSEEVVLFEIPDSIEGWADAFGALIASYTLPSTPSEKFGAYQGKRVYFDFQQIRPKGAMISGGFKAPGPEPLRMALERCEALMDGALASGARRIKPIVAYDFVMHMSDAVLAGGVRRSATICLFDKDDAEMMSAKTGNWFETNPQRGRSNNSVILKRDEVTEEEFAAIMESVKSFGEPGFIFTDDLDACYNPCVEIGMYPFVEGTGESGFQFCNLVEINGGKCTTREKFLKAVRAATILATFQAGYTNFKYVSDATRKITEREALIGVSITGWTNNPEILFDKEILKEGAALCKAVNREVAAMLGIRPAARTTCVKPSGNASVLLQTASGIHGEHAPKYFRNVQMNAHDEVAKYIQSVNPKMVEKSVWSASGTDVVISFPVVSKPDSLFKSELLGVKQLDLVKTSQEFWVNEGTDLDLCVNKTIRHNVSNTISVDNWDEVRDYLFKNRAYFAGVSLLAATGDKDYAQAPFTEVRTPDELLADYGVASMFASGLVVDGLHAFNDLWAATSVVAYGMAIDDSDAHALLKRDWIRRFEKFSKNYFGGDNTRTAYCLKDVYNLHKWQDIQKNLAGMDFVSVLTSPKFVDVDTLGSQGCAGGACEVVF